MANLNKHDLRQLSEDWIANQPEVVVRNLLVRALEDLRAARDRLDQSPRNSSRPSGSMPPWALSAKTTLAEAAADLAEASEPTSPAAPADVDERHVPEVATAPAATPAAAAMAPEAASKPLGRPHGAPGFGRMQHLPPSRHEEHRPSHCTACQTPLSAQAPAKAWTAWDQIEMLPLGGLTDEPVSAVRPTVPRELGLRLQVTRHRMMRQRCACGHESRAVPGHAADDSLWQDVELGQQRLLGPRLAAALVHLCVRMRLPRRKVSELMLEWFGLEISPALISQTVHQSARAVATLEADLAHDLEQAALVHVDETGWREAGQALWWWVLCCTHTALYVIGARSKEMLNNLLAPDFAGTLMSDGYGVYRSRAGRLRCWSHLQRKLTGLAESSDARAASAGAAMLALLEALMSAVYAARQVLGEQRHTPQSAAGAAQALQPPATPCVTHAALVEQLRQLCDQHREAPHPALRAVAREFLNDWEAIMRVLSQPQMPLTNNLAERYLRHHVIARRISFGTRTPVGSRSAALLASIFDTCKLRGARATEFLAHAIHAARSGLPTPALPVIPDHLRQADLAFTKV